VVICKRSLTGDVRRRSVAARLLGLWVRIPSVAWMFVSCECCVLSGRGLCNGPIARLEGGWVDGWMDGWMDRWIDGWMDG